MQAGDILLFKNEDSLIPKLIAWGTGSKYFHVAVCVFLVKLSLVGVLYF